MGLREKVALLLVVVIIFQSFEQYDTKSLRNNVPLSRRTVKSVRNKNLSSKTTRNKQDIIQKYNFTETKYPLTRNVHNSECKTKVTQAQGRNKQFQAIRKRSKIKQKSEGRCSGCSKGKNQTMVTASFPETYCLKKGSFPEIEYPVKASETWQPRYWRMEYDDFLNPSTVPPCTIDKTIPRRQKIKNISTLTKKKSPKKLKKMVNLLDKESSMPNSFNILQNSGNDEFDLSIYERSAKPTNKTHDNLLISTKDEEDCCFTVAPFYDYSPVTEAIILEDLTTKNTSLLFSTVTPSPFISSTFAFECVDPSVNLSDSKIVKCLFDSDVTESKEACLDDTEFIFIPVQKKEKLVLREEHTTTPKPFTTTTEAYEFNTEGPTE